MKEICIWFVVVLLAMSCESSSSDLMYNVEARISVSFTQKDPDTLIKRMEFDRIPGSDLFIGELASITYDESTIYLTDSKRGSVILLDRKDLAYQATIGTGEGNAPGDLKSPVGAFVHRDTLYVEHALGGVLYTGFLKTGDFINTVPRRDFSGFDASFDKSAFIIDGYLYKTVGWAADRNKVRRYALDQPNELISSMVSVEDFGPYRDTSRLEAVHPYLFIFPSKTGESFYAVSGSAPLVNRYNLQGDLLYSYDLGNIKEISDYREQLDALFAVSGPGDDNIERAYTAYFNGIVMDEMERIVYPCMYVGNIDETLANVGDPNIMQASYFFVVVDLEGGTYQLLKCDQGITPMKIIDNNLWCYDRLSATIVIYQLSSS